MNVSNKGFADNTKVKLTGPQIGGMVSAVKHGASYNHFAKRYGVSKSRIRRICESRGAYSKVAGKHRPKYKQPKLSFWERLWYTLFPMARADA